MTLPSGVPSLPWGMIALLLAAATALAWMLGFVAGLLVRWLAPSTL